MQYKIKISNPDVLFIIVPEGDIFHRMP